MGIEFPGTTGSDAASDDRRGGGSRARRTGLAERAI